LERPTTSLNVHGSHLQFCPTQALKRSITSAAEGAILTLFQAALGVSQRICEMPMWLAT